MKNLFYFIAGVFFITLISTTTVSVMTVKPAVPKSTIVKTFRTMYRMEDDIEEYINTMVKDGYVVKSVAMMNDGSRSNGIVVVEKY